MLTIENADSALCAQLIQLLKGFRIVRSVVDDNDFEIVRCLRFKRG